MKLLSLNISAPREVTLDGHTLTTGICKEPVAGRRRLHATNLEGDGQADLDAHGGANKAVYAYPAEHYPHWQAMLKRTFPPGQFGENFTTEGLLEDQVYIGDTFRLGSAVVEAAQPRMPCFKLGLKMGSAKFVKIFMNSGRSGIYMRVVQEGEVAAGDCFEPLKTGQSPFTVRQLWDLCHNGAGTKEQARAALRLDSLNREWQRPLKMLLNS